MYRIKSMSCLFLFLVLLQVKVLAELKMPTFFGNNMVLQQNTSNAIWGWAGKSEKVSIETSWGEVQNTKSDEQGYWKVFLPTPSYRLNEVINISTSSDNLVLKNVAIGEVWLCLGQSNMGWALQNCFGAADDLKNAEMNELRIYKSDRQHWHEPRNDCATG
ncbi:hypothetical protein [Carboxylicivirga sp. RSCT41]|uniref:hypothetical protein n=1 Tax=Carboxylicivirga agarovorans TaxID=3417570 RepID=UPI003D328707